MTFATCFILSGCDRDIDFLRLFFLVRVICPLMQEHSLWLKKLISQAPEDAMFKIRRPVFKRLFKSNYMLRAMQPKKQCKSNLSTVSVLAKRSLPQGLMHSWFHGTTVPNVCLQALTLSLPSSFPLLAIFSPYPKTESLFTGYAELYGQSSKIAQQTR